MSVYSGTISINTKGLTDIHDVTGKVASLVKKSRIKDGVVTVFVPGSTGGMTTVEYEPGLIKDLKEEFEKIFPYKGHYEHNATWGDGNGASHLRASLLGPSISVPVDGGEMTLGTWQQIIFIDFDTRGRSRKLVIKVVGD